MPGMSNRSDIRLALPPSMGAEATERGAELERYLSRTLQREVRVNVPGSYELLARELLTGAVDAAWAPPFVCARVEAMGVRVLVRGIRHGASTFRAALVSHVSSDVTLTNLAGRAAVWTDRDSVGGHLLALAYFRSQGIEPNKTFRSQQFAGNYRAALEAVLGGQADITSVFASIKRNDAPDTTGISELWPEQSHQFRVLAFTDEAPNDGVAVAMSASAELSAMIESAFLSLHETPEGTNVLERCFRAQRFEKAPRLGYRALYRVALASL